MVLTNPLWQPNYKISTKDRRYINAEDIIGKEIRSKVWDSGGRPWNILEASLATYLMYSPRQVTPLYPKYCNIVTSLLDLNLPNPGEDTQFDAGPSFEILEAGTGHGALTLHLARAIHGANPPIPSEIRDDLVTSQYRFPKSFLTHTRRRVENKDEALSEESTDTLAQKEGSKTQDGTEVPLAVAAEENDVPIDPQDPHQLRLPESSRGALAAYLPTRRAIIHTFDIQASFQRVAHNIIRRFKRALYLPSINFHTGNIRLYLAQRLEESGGAPFLSHCVLDLPDPMLVGATDEICKSLLPGGLLLVFNPSVTQIADVVAAIMKDSATMNLERVIEMSAETPGPGDSPVGDTDVGGGRDWTVKAVIVKGRESEGWKYVCRPKYGNSVAAGGFVGIFRKFHVKPRLESDAKRFDETVIKSPVALESEETSQTAVDSVEGEDQGQESEPTPEEGEDATSNSATSEGGTTEDNFKT
ncbi:tRNA (Adenine-N(1)-)-methyltransferase [Zalerion maritima]|uniref:tRNA (adenine(58)-N(1))-methyltransferase catalytic subunit TRM61 n=1 Tax=Zalerion maritima TaxID=339359 RepID=A0AAD5S231_9PEZI|nr:tRNA (Adenine-N(1)-)-methyltransferase [Zalerion maritima]